MTQQAHNTFGIKAGTTWKGPTKTTKTTEYKDGKPYETTAAWRVYPSFEDCIRDHLRMVMKVKRYTKAAAKLQRGDSDYMAQLGRDGWFTDIPDKVNKEWWACVTKVRAILAKHPDWQKDPAVA